MHLPERLALLLAAAAIGFQCFVPPSIGLANNGDFPKIIGQFDVGDPAFQTDVVRYADLRYVVDPKYHWDSKFHSSEVLLFEAALGLDSILGRAGTFDLRFMGAVNAAIFLLAFYRLLPLLQTFRPKIRILLLGIILFMFTDVMYVNYFNSFFMDTAALLFLLLAVVSFLRALHWKKAADRWLFVASAMLLVTSKTQHYPLGLPIALLLAWQGGLLIAGRSRAFRIASAICVLGATGFSKQFGAPSHYPSLGAYTVIFFELLPKSKNVTGDLKDLSLDDSYQRYVGTNAYSSDAGVQDPQVKDVFERKISYGRLAGFFAKHPVTALEIAITRLNSAGRQRPYAGNYDRRTGFPEYAQTHSFTLWSGLKNRVFGEHGGLYLLYAIALALVVPFLAMERRAGLPLGIPTAVIALTAVMLTALLVASFADALDAERHFSLFSALCDLLLLCGVGIAAATSTPAQTPIPNHRPASEELRPGTSGS